MSPAHQENTKLLNIYLIHLIQNEAKQLEAKGSTYSS